MAKTYSKIFFISTSIFLIIIFFVLGYFIGRTPVLNEKVSKELVQKEFLNELRGAGFLMPLPEELKTLRGDIIELDKSFIVLQPQEDTRINPLGVQFPKEMKFLVNQGTKFLVAHERDWDEFVQEYEAYRQEREKRGQAGESMEGLVEPEPYTYEIIGPEDLRIGDSVKVVCDADILRSEGDFWAQEIVVINEVEGTMEK